MLRLGFALAWSILVSINVTGQSALLRVYYPDIEQGAATLIVSPTGKALLVDGGTGLNDTDQPIEDFIADLIDAGVVASLNFIVATHYDEDHIGRVENVFQMVPLAPDLIAYDRGDFGVTPNTFAFRDYRFQAEKHNRTTISPGATIDLGGGVTVHCVAVNGQLPDGSSVDLTDAAQFENAASVALVVRFGEFDLWIGGDLTDNPDEGHPAVETAAAAFAGDMDVYSVDHHGSRSTSSSPDFLNLIKPEVAINQNSADNNHGHPTAEVVRRILETPATQGLTPRFLQTNPGNPNDGRSDDSLASGIADPDDDTGPKGLPGNIAVVSDGSSYQVFGGNIEPLALPADSGPGDIGDFPPAILRVAYSPLVPHADESVTVEAEIRDEGTVSVSLVYSLDDWPQMPVEMEKIGQNGTYRGVIPPQGENRKVSFRVSATDALDQKSLSMRTGYFSGISRIATIRKQNADGVLLARGFAARVQGNITVEPGLFNDFVSQIYLQDRSGGLNVFSPGILPLIRGDLVQFTGEIGQFGGVGQISIAERRGNFGFQVVGSGSPPVAEVVTIAQLGDELEGRLVRINGVRVTGGIISANQDTNLTVSDDGGASQTTLRIDANTDIPGVNTPTGSFDIVGVVSQFDNTVPFDSGFRILPRDRSDFISSEVNHPDVLIAEIHADPDPQNGDANGDGVVSTSQDEFVEIVNTTLAHRDIGGFTIADEVGVRFTFPDGTVLPPREAAVVFGGGTPSGRFGNAAANGLVFTAGTLGLNNDGDAVVLADSDGNPVHIAAYGREGRRNQSLVRDPDWSNSPLKLHKDTAGGLGFSPGTRVNGKPYMLPPGALILSEVLYDPDGADGKGEWIELYNASEDPIDLSEVSIGCGGNTYTTTLIKLSGTVAPGATFVVGGPESGDANGNPVFDLEKDFSPDIQNSGTIADGVALFNLPFDRVRPETVPIDAVVFGTENSNDLMDARGAPAEPQVGDASGGASIERIDLAGQWQIQPNPQPNRVRF